MIADISSQLNGDTLTAEQQALVDEQLKQQEALELQHREQQRNADHLLDEELADQQRTVEDQINQQKRLVREFVINILFFIVIQSFLLLRSKLGFNVFVFCFVVVVGFFLVVRFLCM